MLAIPALQTERKSRRIVAVLSKGIHRWQYLAGLWLGCSIITTCFSLMLAVIALILCRAGNYRCQGLWPMTLALIMCCSMAVAVSVLYSVVLHPFLAIAATTITLVLPYVVRTDWRPLAGLFPVWWFSEAMSRFHFNGAPHAPGISLSALLPDAIFSGDSRYGLRAPGCDYVAGVGRGSHRLRVAFGKASTIGVLEPGG